MHVIIIWPKFIEYAIPKVNPKGNYRPGDGYVSG